ncbi:hypothetical protein [Nocardiopsis sp. B62]|uniref:hypothetical protein n=1 Tax=Nocardiopsis sp. B62 TaxID=2824874 RepID=UPI001B389499|nr:hypothetical protein [Nocardiopsis sp. B62]MBQ1081485.1 hypothetical protein [Nocardiopsis sp. B62]
MSAVPTFWALTRFNLRHLLVSPVFLVVVPVTLVGLVYSAYQPPMPTWSDLIDQVRLQALGLAAVMFAVTTFPAIREVRHSEGFALPLSARARLLSLSLASVLVTSVCVGVLVLSYLVVNSQPTAGTASPPAVLALFVLAWCGPLGAVASAVWTRSYTPLVVLLLLVPAYLLYTVTSMGTRADEILRRLNGVARWVLDPLPIDEPAVTALGVLSLVHISFMAAFLLVFALARREGSWVLRPVTLGAAALLLVGVAFVNVYAQRTYSYETPFTDQDLYGAEADPCRVREGVTYCPLPGYESWIDYWHAALSPTVARIPDHARDRLPVVWQGTQHLRRDVREFQTGGLVFPRSTQPFPPPGTVIVFDEWDPEVPYYRDALAIEVTMNVLGLPRHWDHSCSGQGQARIVLGAWLVSADERFSEPEGTEAAEEFLSYYDPSELDLRMTHALLDLPPSTVSDVLEEHWESLLSADTTTEELAELLELPLTADGTIPAPAWEFAQWSVNPFPYDSDWRHPVCR